ETTVSDLAQQILELTGSRSTTRSVSYADVYGPDFAEPKRRTPDMSKAQRILGFVPQIELGEGLRRTIAWARQAYVTH
ncbi:MAG: NAD-dependent dehydratase, partial [bacterium]